MKKIKIKPAEIIEDGKPAADWSDPVQYLCELAGRIRKGDYGSVMNVHVVVEAKKRRTAVLSFGEPQRDPAKALWRGVEEVARISDPSYKCVVAPKFEPYRRSKHNRKEKTLS